MSFRLTGRAARESASEGVVVIDVDGESRKHGGLQLVDVLLQVVDRELLPGYDSEKREMEMALGVARQTRFGPSLGSGRDAISRDPGIEVLRARLSEGTQGGESKSLRVGGLVGEGGRRDSVDGHDELRWV